MTLLHLKIFFAHLRILYCLFRFSEYCYSVEKLSVNNCYSVGKSSYVYPNEMGRHIVLSFVVRPSIRPSVCPSRFRVCFISYPFWDLQITFHKCHVWWVNVQCICLTKVMVIIQGLALYDCITCPLYNSWRVCGILKWLGTNVKYDESMSSAYDWPKLVHSQVHSLRLNIVWLRPFTKFNNWLQF